MADPKKQIPDVLTDDDFDVPDVLTDADFEDAGGNVLSNPPLRGPGGLGAMDKFGRFDADMLPQSPEDLAAQQRQLLEVGGPLLAGLLMGPQAGLLARTAAMGAAGGGASLLSELFDPTQEPQVPGPIPAKYERAIESGMLGAGSELAAGPIGLGLASASRGLRSGGDSLLRRGLGFMQSHLRRLGPNGVERANEIAHDAFDTGAIGMFTGENELARRFANIAQGAGQELGAMRQAIDASNVPRVPIGNVVHDIDQAVANWRPGISDEPVLQRNLNAAIQDAIAHSDANLEAGMVDLADLKEIFARRSAFHSLPNPSSKGADLVAPNRAARAVVQDAEEAQAAAALTPEEFAEFLRNKELYGTMQELIDPGYGSLISLEARNAGNSLAGLLPTVAAAGRGDPLSALGTLLVTRGLSQRGAQAGGVFLNRLSQGLGMAAQPDGASLLGQALVQMGGRGGLGLASPEDPKREER